MLLFKSISNERKGELIPMPGGYGCPGDRRAYDYLRLEETLARGYIYIIY